jgi:hypothetical protein
MAELIRSIRRGFENEKATMPLFGSVLSEQDIQNVIASIRQAFDPLRARGRERRGEPKVGRVFDLITFVRSLVTAERERIRSET